MPEDKIAKTVIQPGVEEGPRKPVDPQSIRLLRQPAWDLCMTLEKDRTYIRVKVVLASPLSRPDTHISILDIKDQEICMISDPSELDQESYQIIQDELEKRYLTSTVYRINSVRSEFGTSYWEVETDRGRREFVIRGTQDSALWLGDHRLLLIDVDGDRFEIPDYTKLDPQSIGFVETIL